MVAGDAGLKARFKQLTARERNIILVLALVVVVFLWDQLLFAPLQRDSQKVKQQINALNNNLATQTNQLTEVMESAKHDPNRELKQKHQQLSQSLQQLETRQQSLTANLIPPRQMAEVLEQVLRQKTRLKLVKVTSLPAEKLTGTTEQTQSGAGKSGTGNSETSVLYRHGVELELEGSYFETLGYLRSLEQLRWKVLWDSLEYEVQEYPRAQIRLQINTLSTNAGWIGV